MEEKLVALKDKYKNAKHLKEEQKKTINDLQVRLDDAIVGREAVLERVAAVEGSVASKVETVFDALEFLNTRKANAPQPPTKTMKPCTSNGLFRLSQEAGNLCVPGGPIRYNRNQVVWPKDSLDHCLIFTPTYCINPKAQAGISTWQKFSVVDGLAATPCEKRDLFYSPKDVWYYYGTYECIGYTTLSATELRKLGANYLEWVMRRTVLSPELVPPVITNMIHSMYAEGVLMIACLGFRYVRRNLNLVNALNAEIAGKTLVAVPKEGPAGSASATLKRGQDEDSNGSRSHKKAKKSS